MSVVLPQDFTSRFNNWPRVRAILETIGEPINYSFSKCCGRTLISLTERSAPGSFASCVNTITASVVGRMPVNRGRSSTRPQIQGTLHQSGTMKSGLKPRALKKKFADESQRRCRSRPLCIAIFFLPFPALCRPCWQWRRLPTYRKCPPIQRLLRADRFCRRAEIEVVPIKSAFLALCSVP
jgi:hypothetical protein